MGCSVLVKVDVCDWTGDRDGFDYVTAVAESCGGLDDDVGILHYCSVMSRHGLKGVDAVESFGEFCSDAADEDGAADDVCL